ncbi:hypothetical protein [Tenuifilum sp.]|jgi:hypothetical protein|uniref:hypothetical protein n=2 Tax=Tenuifilum sp. TaxID=2760880 RepID=UPI002B99202A|nr:hypothetical protein [Tenuifilum sp.]HOK86889.1 hypothetical protein [Tenuifilum sp.]HPP89383.1 hypothetical protein [Tenuifilum sp.]HRR12554.1 hypothetical protein [Tenuifilum sp.]
MKITGMRFIALLLITFLPIFSIAQETLDTIILVSNRKLICNVKSVSSSKVTILKKDAAAPEELSRKQIHKILYANGRVEKFNDLAFKMIDETNFQSVVITTNPADVDGLYIYGKVESVSGKNSKNAKSAEKNARIRLQRKAAALGANYVLVTKSESRGGYKEVPTHYYEGVAYGFEPPKNENQTPH